MNNREVASADEAAGSPSFFSSSASKIVTYVRSHVPQFGSSPPTEHQLEEVRSDVQRLSKFSDLQLEEVADRLRHELSGIAKHKVTHFWQTAFSLCIESARRVHGMQHFDSQLMAGHVLIHGGIAEMATGEGKTLVATLPATLMGLRGQGVHIATTSHYLAERDHEFVQPILKRLGISAGLLPEEFDARSAAEAYRYDVTYGTGYQFGFDFLRDQISLRHRHTTGSGNKALAKLRGFASNHDLLCRHRAFAVIDEVDSVLIDEANMPLILSSLGDSESADAYQLADCVARDLRIDQDYRLNKARSTIELTPQGRDASGKALAETGVIPLVRSWQRYVLSALRAHQLLKRDVDYVVQEGEVCIVDKFTGRIAPERKWSDGLHQAVEAKEQLALSPKNETTARVSRQHYFQKYSGICGMTGTARGSQREFRDCYDLPVTAIPLHRPSQRTGLSPRYFLSFDAKHNAIALATRELIQKNRPVLIGTRTIDVSKQIAEVFKREGISFTILNGVQDRHEAEVVAEAGIAGRVTIATNMAGRGTDIKPDKHALLAGGLHVIVTEHHESDRIDRQLVGRCARQGQPGSFQFFISAEDDLFKRFAPWLANRIRKDCCDDQESQREYASAIASIQERVQAEFAKQRRRLTLRDHWDHENLRTLFDDGRTRS